MTSCWRRPGPWPSARVRFSLTRLIEQGLALRLCSAASGSACTSRPALPVHMGRDDLTAAVADPRRNSALFDAAEALRPSSRRM
jgi:hypothetical protein